MRALWLEDRQLRLRDDLPKPVPPAGEVLVRVLAAGICSTDLELVRGYYPFTGIPGHEFVGVVEEGALAGRRVAGEINAVCHACQACRGGRPTHCEKRTVLGIIGRNGAFAEYLTLPVENLHVIPDHLPDEIAVFIEPLAAALEIQQQIAVGAGDQVLVVGDGKLGQLVARTLALTGCHLVVAGRHQEKLALLQTLGIETVSPEAIERHRFDIAIECSGDAGGFDIARDALRPRGTLVMKSTYAGKLTLNASSLVVDEITLLGSRCGPFAPALGLLAEQRIDPRPLLQATYSLDDGVAAFEHAATRGVLKVLIHL